MGTTKRSATDVTIACKLPHGLVIPLDDGSTFRINGYHSPGALADHGFTRGVPVATWEAIQAKYAEAPWLVNGFVFASSQPESAVAEATERQKTEAGFEPIDPNQLPGGIQQEGANDPAAR